jgi:hypothetical protein
MSERIDVDAILASLGPELDDAGKNPWGSANLERCGDPACRCSRLNVTDAEMRILRTLAAIADRRRYQLDEFEEHSLDQIEAILRGEAS